MELLSFLSLIFVIIWGYGVVFKITYSGLRLKPISQKQELRYRLFCWLFGILWFVKPGKLYRLFGGVVGRLASM
jgi:hypothetical protein